MMTIEKIKKAINSCNNVSFIARNLKVTSDNDRVHMEFITYDDLITLISIRTNGEIVGKVILGRVHLTPTISNYINIFNEKSDFLKICVVDIKKIKYVLLAFKALATDEWNAMEIIGKFDNCCEYVLTENEGYPQYCKAIRKFLY